MTVRKKDTPSLGLCCHAAAAAITVFGLFFTDDVSPCVTGHRFSQFPELFLENASRKMGFVTVLREGTETPY